jgi:nucleotide-binding universal stress UspA family protein
MIPKIKKILYATDLSPNSGYVLRYAINSAKHHGAKLVVLHAIEDLPATAKTLVEPYLNPEISKKMFEEKVEYAQKRILDRLKKVCKKELNSSPISEGIFESIEVVEGYPADEILNKADQFDCDVIIMGTHSKGILEHAYFGSTSKKVLRRVRKPVFVIPVPKGKTDITVNEE